MSVGVTRIHPDRETLKTLSALAMRSKAHWGYDAAFLEACRPALTLSDEKIGQDLIAVTRDGNTVTGFVQVGHEDGTAHLEKLFVDPFLIGTGRGKALMQWAITTARQGQAREIRIESDPDAARFYARFGAVQIGEVPSEAIPGRALPLLCITL